MRILFKWILLLLVCFLVACSDTDNRTTVTLSGWQSSPTEKERLEQVLRDFEAKHPSIRVKFEVISDQYMDVIKTRLIGDAAPDVFYLDAFDAPLLMKYGVLEPLNDYLDAIDLNDFKPSLLEAFIDEGKIYGLPKDFSTLALFYNKQLFEQAQLIEPPKTWQDLQNYSRKLTLARNGKKEHYGLGITPELARQVFLIKAFGGTLVNQGYAAFATAKGLKGLQKLVDLYRNRTAALPSDVGASSGSEMFGQGKAAMVIEGPWAIPYLQETFPDIEFATAQVPTLAGRRGTMAYTVAYVMNGQAKHKQAAWELIAYLTGQEGMKAWATAGLVLPSRQSVLAALGYEQNSLYAPFIRGTAYATIWQAGENLPAIANQFNNQFLSALLGQPLAVAMKKAQATANREIQASNY